MRSVGCFINEDEARATVTTHDARVISYIYYSIGSTVSVFAARQTQCHLPRAGCFY